MRKKLFTALALAGLLAAITPVFASKNYVPTQVAPRGEVVAEVVIPENAAEVAPNVFDIGLSVDIDGAILQGYAIIHPKAPKVKPQNPGNGSNGGTTSTCYAFLAKGAKWKSTEDYSFDATNTVDLATTTIRALLSDSLQKWDNAAGVEIFGNQASSIVDLNSVGNSTNGVNEVAFASISSPGTIAVTYVWGVFGGPVQGRYLAEWDMVIDQADFTWNTDGNIVDMDFENIITHETGHAAGLGHPSDSCSEETMYRYASEGETKKRTLSSGDIAGAQVLY